MITRWISLVGGVVGHQSRRQKLSERVRQWELYSLILGNRLLEGPALQRPVRRDADQTLRSAAAAGRNHEPFDREPLLRALASAARNLVGGGHAAILEAKLGVGVHVGVVHEARGA